MSDSLTPRQMINVELAVRAENEHAKNIIENHTPADVQDGMVIQFNCECSDPACTERIGLTLKQYDDLHTTQSKFVIIKDHVEPVVEKIANANDDIAIVDKFALS